ncbi:MAG: iron-containing alcohol dehydrogenase [Ruminococcaceae bacterium]|nr:iron-containing alcohol dehydrogenase [Oscillospiraceae bacterium]
MTELKIMSDVCFGENSLEALSRYKNRNIVIYTDPFLAESGMVNAVLEKLDGNSCHIYTKIAPDPSIEQVGECYKFAKEHNADLFIAFGGGSAIDTAKAVLYVDADVSGGKNIELVAIPTTAGTGSEVTDFSVISDTENGVKYPIVDKKMAPDLAILCAEFTVSVPPKVTAATGMDVITHLLEAYVSNSANIITDSVAEKGLALAFDNIYKAYKEGTDIAARDNMLMASYLAGVAFNNAGLGITHSIAHGLGANFHISHGLANAMVLPHVIAFNSCLDVPFGMDKSVAAQKYATAYSKIGCEDMGTRLSVMGLIKKINEMLRLMKVPVSLSECGVSREAFEQAKPIIVKSALADVCTTYNPRVPEAKNIENILDRLYNGM